MKTVRLAMALILALACARGVRAVSVTASDATYAATRWAASGAAFEGGPGTVALKTDTLSATNGATLYAVRFTGGTAFVSSDTELEPIVAYTSQTNFTPAAESKLWRLLRRDTVVRWNMLKAERRAALALTSAASGALSAASSATNAASGRWARLLGARNARATVSKATGAEPPNQLMGVTDVRVAPLVKSKWSQQTARGYPCYNYYTPNNAPCGCTATAMSQIMRYHEFPKTEVTPKTYPCKVNGVPQNLTMQGGIYNWDNMPLVPASVAYDEAQWKEIGKLTSDAGIAIKSSYTSGAGSSYVSLVGGALKDAFGYANGAALFNWSVAEEAAYGDGTVHTEAGLHKLAIREKIIYANLDAKCPVELGIYGYGDEMIGKADYWEGHAVVGDGYGYSDYGGEAVPYVHINLGWAGLDDAWYNVPEVHSPNSGSYYGSEGTGFTVLSAAAYNLFPTNTGNIVSGRVCDDEGEFLGGITMTICQSGSSTVLATTTTDSKGIYAFIVPGGKNYTVSCDVPGAASETSTICLPKDTLECNDVYGKYTEKDANVGNYWGHDADFEVGSPCVRNLTRSIEYMSLSKALSDAEENDVLEVYASARLKRDATVSKNVTILTKLADPTTVPVPRANGATLTVQAGVTLSLSNIVFSTGAAPAVCVLAGGKVALAGKIGLGEFSTKDAGGVVVAGPLTAVGPGLTLNNPKCGNADDVFGTATCDLETAKTSAGQILNSADVDLFGSAMDDSGTVRLYWAERPVDPTTALAYAKGWRNGEEDVTTYYNSFTKLFKGYTNGAEIVVLKDAKVEAFASDLIVDIVKPTIIRSSTGTARKIFPGAGSCFRVHEGSSLAVTNIVFDGSVQEAKSVVDVVTFSTVTFQWYTNAVTNVTLMGWSANGNGQFLDVEGGELTLGAGTTVQNFATQRKSGQSSGWSKSPYGAVLLNGGTLTLGGATISACTAMGNGVQYGVSGGGIAAVAGQLNLVNATVKDCQAAKNGGAVYVWDGVGVRIEGKTVVSDNKSGAGTDDIYLATTNVLPVVGALTAGAKVFFRFGAGSADDPCGNYDGCQFAEADGVDGDTVGSMLFNDVLKDDKVSYAAELEAGSSRIVWKKTVGVQPGKRDTDGPLVKAIVTASDGTKTYWTTLKNALNGLDGDAEILLKSSQELGGEGDVVIGHNLRICATNDLGTLSLKRTTDISLVIGEGASLSLSNVVAETVPMIVSTSLGDIETYYTVPFFYVNGGALTCDCVRVTGYNAGPSSVNKAPRRSGAVCVWNGGDFTMRNTTIQDVLCRYVDTVKNIESAAGAGVLVEGNSTAHLESGMITNCWAQFGGAFCVGNDSEVWIGDVALYGNYLNDGDTPSNVMRYQTGKIHLMQPPVQKIGMKIGRSMLVGDPALFDDTNLVAEVSADWTEDQLKTAAGCFRRDPDGCVGKAVTNATEAFIVWRTALTDDDLYIDARGITNALVGWGASKPPEVAIPKAKSGMVYNGHSQTGLEDDGYRDIRWKFDFDSDYKSLDWGTYYAVVRLVDPDNTVWADGSSDAKRIRWSMAQKPLTITWADGIPDWNLAEHSSNERPGYGTDTKYVWDYYYFDDYWSVDGICDPPDTKDSVIFGYGYYSPQGGEMSTSTVYSVNLTYNILNGNYYVASQQAGKLHVVSNALSSAVIQQLISNPRLVLMTGGISGGNYGSAIGAEAGAPTADEAGIVLEIDNAPAGTYNLKGSDTLVFDGFTTEATQTLQETGTLRLQAPASKSTQHFWRIEYVKP